jgi:hypothetical protein
MPAGQVRRKLTAQEMGVAAGEHKRISVAVQSVDKKFPPGQILDFIEEQRTRPVVHRIDSGKQLPNGSVRS